MTGYSGTRTHPLSLEWLLPDTNWDEISLNTRHAIRATVSGYPGSAVLWHSISCRGLGKAHKRLSLFGDAPG